MNQHFPMHLCKCTISNAQELSAKRYRPRAIGNLLVGTMNLFLHSSGPTELVFCRRSPLNVYISVCFSVSSVRDDRAKPFFLLALRKKSTKAMYIWALVTVECWPWRKIRVALLDDQGQLQSKASRYAF